MVIGDCPPMSQVGFQIFRFCSVQGFDFGLLLRNDILSYIFVESEILLMASTTLESAIKASRVKIFYNKEGKASEVMMSYELFLEFLSYLPEEDQAYFWTEEWQAKEQAADQANVEGRYKTFSSMEGMLDFLDAQ